MFWDVSISLKEFKIIRTQSICNISIGSRKIIYSNGLYVNDKSSKKPRRWARKTEICQFDQEHLHKPTMDTTPVTFHLEKCNALLLGMYTGRQCPRSSLSLKLYWKFELSKTGNLNKR